MDNRQSLDEADWASYHDAFGVAAEVPDLLRALSGTAVAERHGAWDELMNTIWHQETVYSVTPVCVPFLVDVVESQEVDEGTRIRTVLLLFCMSTASTFILDEQPGVVHRASWLRTPGAPPAPRDLIEETRLTVAGQMRRLRDVFMDGPRVVQVAMLGLLAAIHDHLTDEMVERIHVMESDTDRRVSNAARITHALAMGRTLDSQELFDLASVDAAGQEYLDGAEGLPLPVCAVELANELSHAALAAHW